MSRAARSVVILAMLAGVASSAPAQVRIDSVPASRLAALGKLWNAVKYFHPALAERPVAWDSAVVAAVPRVMAARTAADYGAAVEEMLRVLDDPVTRVVPPAPPPAAPAPAAPIPWRFETDSVLVVSIRTPAAVTDFSGGLVALQKLSAMIPSARHVVFDLRLDQDLPPGGGAVLGYVFGASGVDRALALGTESGPGQRSRVHSGLAPRFGGTSGDYASGFRVAEGPRFADGGGRADQRIVFLANRRSPLPPIALALQASGRGAIVAEEGIDDAALIRTERITLTDGIAVQLRTSELLWPDGTTGAAPDTTISASGEGVGLGVALTLARSGGVSHSASRFRPPAVSVSPIDDAYQAMTYPSLPYRLLAGFRIWGVFRYLFPYREYQHEDWDAVLVRSLPTLAAARDSLEYALAVAEMVTHVHDSHAFVSSPTLFSYWGLYAPSEVRVRLIGGVPVVTEAGKDSPLHVGDVITAVDGESSRARIERLGRPITASTPQARAARVGDLFLNGAEGSTATVAVDRADGSHRRVELVRSRHVYRVPQPPPRRDQPVTQILSGNIGYADLARLPVSSVDSMFAAFASTRGIIFDMRGYPLGTAWAIAPRLTDRPSFIGACFWRIEAESPNDDAVSRIVFGQRIEAQGPRYSRPTVLLIDERAISQAEHTGLLLRAANGTVFVGSPTQGANGDVTNFVVPGRIVINLSGQGVKGVDGTQLQRRGLVPDVPASTTLAGIRAGKDEILERAVRYLEAGGGPVRRPEGDCGTR